MYPIPIRMPARVAYIQKPTWAVLLQCVDVPYRLGVLSGRENDSGIDGMPLRTVVARHPAIPPPIRVKRTLRCEYRCSLRTRIVVGCDIGPVCVESQFLRATNTRQVYDRSCLKIGNVDCTNNVPIVIVDLCPIFAKDRRRKIICVRWRKKRLQPTCDIQGS